MLCGSAFKNKGVQRCWTRWSTSCRRRSTCRRVPGHDDDDKEVVRHADDSEKFAALAFKLMTDPYVGQLTFVRVYPGVLKSGRLGLQPRSAARRNASAGSCRCTPNQREEIKEILAGDIAACVGLREVTTGETCAIRPQSSRSRKCSFPEPVISQAVEPKTKADQEKMGIALQPSGAGRSDVPRHRPTKSPARPSSRAWASCTSKLLSNASSASSRAKSKVGKPQVAYP